MKSLSIMAVSKEYRALVTGSQEVGRQTIIYFATTRISHQRREVYRALKYFSFVVVYIAPDKKVNIVKGLYRT